MCVYIHSFSVPVAFQGLCLRIPLCEFIYACTPYIRTCKTYVHSLSCGLYSQCTSFPVICHFRRKEIPQDFPAEHPYSSHREKFRVFPDTRREEDVLSSDKEIVEVPLCKVIDRAQFKGWRREEVGYYRPFSARNRAEDEERLRLATRALTTKHKVYLCVLCLCMMHCTQVHTYMCVQ